MRISDWSSDVCSSDLHHRVHAGQLAEALGHEAAGAVVQECRIGMARRPRHHRVALVAAGTDGVEDLVLHPQHARHQVEVAADQLRLEQFAEAARVQRAAVENGFTGRRLRIGMARSEEHTSELQSLMRISYSVFCLKKKKTS